MDEFDTALKYLFTISLILVLVAYYAGTKNILQTLFSGSNTLILTSTGRNSAGQFASYPTGG